MPGNYSYTEYLLLISLSESLEELDLLDEQLKEDREDPKSKISINDYIRIKATWTLKMVDLTLDEAKDKL